MKEGFLSYMKWNGASPDNCIGGANQPIKVAVIKIKLHRLKDSGQYGEVNENILLENYEHMKRITSCVCPNKRASYDLRLYDLL